MSSSGLSSSFSFLFFFFLLRALVLALDASCAWSFSRSLVVSTEMMFFAFFLSLALSLDRPRVFFFSLFFALLLSFFFFRRRRRSVVVVVVVFKKVVRGGTFGSRRSAAEGVLSLGVGGGDLADEGRPREVDGLRRELVEEAAYEVPVSLCFVPEGREAFESVVEGLRRTGNQEALQAAVVAAEEDVLEGPKRRAEGRTERGPMRQVGLVVFYYFFFARARARALARATVEDVDAGGVDDGEEAALGNGQGEGGAVVAP
mmetsp:Transcript_8259/g.27062  ORF Transcript_8259/g.27062 Transcript_8259/m.27062 type:complete len:259 (-) Transcript_8259:929-1705(-)